MNSGAASNAFESIMRDLHFQLFSYCDEENIKNHIPVLDTCHRYLDRVNYVTEYCQKNGRLPQDVSLHDLDSNELFPQHTSEDSTKENSEPNIQVPAQNTRPSRFAAKTATQMITQHSTQSLSTKLRRPTSDDKSITVVKNEKKSTVLMNPTILVEQNIDETLSVENVKKEDEEMSVTFKKTLPKSKRQKKIKQEKIEKIEEVEETELNMISSDDVILQEIPIPTVEIADSDEEKCEDKEKKNTRNKTSWEKKNTKRTRNAVSDDEEKTSTGSKKSKCEDEVLTEQSQYNDALSTVEASQANDATYIAKPSKSDKGNIMDTTVIIEKPRVVNAASKITVSIKTEDLVTDDESDLETTSKASGSITNQTTKQLSPCERRPNDKKVEGSKMLYEESNVLPPRTTRTKTRALAKEQETINKEEAPPESSDKIMKDKTKYHTPINSKVIPKSSSTTSKNTPQYNEPKSMSVLKASQAEYREREKQRREKEEEALRKREALLQAQIENKKRKREEKQLKAQRLREALEKEKLKILEAQKTKEEKHKQIIQKQEEKKQRQREEAEKKRMGAKLKALEEKKKETDRLEQQKEKSELAGKLVNINSDVAKWAQRNGCKNVPIYMISKEPYLPTDDCYDSEDEKFMYKRQEPSWVKSSAFHQTLMCMQAIGEPLKNSFFSRKVITPDLQEIFEVISPRKLQRKSSAIWHKRPRFSMIPAQLMESQKEESSEDDY